MPTGASGALNVPIIDGDFMGRAYPTGWQTTPNVYDYSGRGENLLPACIDSGDGTAVVSRLSDSALSLADIVKVPH